MSKLSSYVLALQHSPTEPLGILGEALAAAGVVFRCIRSFDGEPVPTDMGEAAGLIVLGGSMNVSDQEWFPFLTDEMRLIARALEQRRPVLGICLGGQLLAHTLGADVRRAERLEVGWHSITITEPDDAFFQGLPSSFTGFHWHGHFFTLPVGAVSLAYSELTPCQAFRCGDGVYGIQFHMEVTEGIIRDWAASGGEEMVAAETTAEAILGGIQPYLPAQQRLGRLAFQRWAERARAVCDALD